MIYLTGPQCVSICDAYGTLEEIALDNERGIPAAELYISTVPKAQAFQSRQQAMFKEYGQILMDHAQLDESGNVIYGNASSGKPEERPVLWKDPLVASQVLDAWHAKARELDAHRYAIDCNPLRDDFFEKPKAIVIKQNVRTGLLYAMQKYQATIQSEG